MPLYEYEYLDENGDPTGERIEITHSIHDDALTEDEEGRPIRRAITAPDIILTDTTQPKTIGTLAEKNQEKMIKRGDERIKKEKIPWWRKGKKKPFDPTKHTDKETRNYIFKGHT